MRLFLIPALIIGLSLPAYADTLKPNGWKATNTNEKSANSNMNMAQHNTASGNKVISPEEHEAHRTETSSFFSSNTKVQKNSDGTTTIKKILNKSGHHRAAKAWSDLNN